MSAAEWEMYESIYEEAKRDNPADPWAMYNARCGELNLSRARKANARGSRYHNPLTTLVKRANKRKPCRKH